MANVKIDGMDQLVRMMQQANILDDATQKEMLNAGADILIDNISDEMVRSHFTIGHLTNKLTKTKIKRNKYYEPQINVTVKGKNLNGVRNAAVLFVLNYGRGKKYGEIVGDYFWTKGLRKSEKEIQKRLEEIATEKLKERGLI